MEEPAHVIAVLALIILFARWSGVLSMKTKQPPVVGMILIGLLLGPSGIHLLQSGLIIKFLAKVGVILLLFMAGLDTNIRTIRKTGMNAMVVAIGGVLVPFLSGLLLGLAFSFPIYKTLIISTILTATSVSVSVMTLMDLKRLRTVEGVTIMNAAIIDDILGILLLTFILSTASHEGSLLLSLGKIVAYLAAIALFGTMVLPGLVRLMTRLGVPTLLLSMAIVCMLLFAWSAEGMGIADITGAYFAGLFFGMCGTREKLLPDLDTLGHALFIPVFFINIGLETHIWHQDVNILFAALFILVAVGGKTFGAGICARFRGFSWQRSLGIGCGMVPRGEVALVISKLSLDMAVLHHNEHSTTVLMVLCTTLVTPFLLKGVFARQTIGLQGEK